MLLFDEDCVALNIRVENSKDAIFLLSDLLKKKGAVSTKYGEAAYIRELSYPTGLPTKPFSIAFPHADISEVHQSAFALASLEEPVVFRDMEDPKVELMVKVVFLMAISSPDEQVKVLRRFSAVFKKTEKLSELCSYTTISGLVAWMRKELKLMADQ